MGQQTKTSRRRFLAATALGAAASALPVKSGSAAASKPNMVVIFCDDMGYGDAGFTGHPSIATPNLDRMAREGVVLTQFYSASSVCSPSRAALLTGRYPIRTTVTGVLFPKDKKGLPPSEKTIATLLKPQGYATACIGKWHLGHHKQFLPTQHGFDYYYGIPYSNDMDRGDMPPIPLMRNEEIIEQPCDQNTVTKRYTEETVRFIETSVKKGQPFFVYLAHTMPHVPLYCSDAFRGKSKRGLYGDVIEEIDWSTGEVLRSIQKLGVDDNTLVIFTSDNGPWLSKKDEGGSAGLFRGGKAMTWEGGHREPCIVRYPGVLPAGARCHEVGSTMDIFTTCVKAGGAEIPSDRPIDGHDLMPMLTKGEASQHETLAFWYGNRLCAVRSGTYKLHLYTFQREFNPGSERLEQTELYDVEVDPSEQYNIAKANPDTVARLMKIAKWYEQEMKLR
jgi:arylsulfatase A